MLLRTALVHKWDFSIEGRALTTYELVLTLRLRHGGICKFPVSTVTCNVTEQLPSEIAAMARASDAVLEEWHKWVREEQPGGQLVTRLSVSHDKRLRVAGRSPLVSLCQDLQRVISGDDVEVNEEFLSEGSWA